MSASCSPEDRQPVDLDNERKRATFDVSALKEYLMGGKDRAKKYQYFQNLVQFEPAFRKDDMYFMDRSQQYKRALGKCLRLEELKRDLTLSESDYRLLRENVDDDLPNFIHSLMFVPNLRALFTDEQQSKWLGIAENWGIIGCYAQTEMGHGSNVRGLETTATYLPETDEFDIHSPTLSSTKWWPGTMGRTATHAVVYARLLLSGRDHGIHSFLVQLRSTEDHSLLRGVIAGDIGPKIGFNNMDNGFCRFTHVRIPRTNMAMRYTQVSADGVYSRRSHSKISYVSMMEVRALIVRGAGLAMARGVTIAIRYAAVRRQGFLSSGGSGGSEERQILDYTVHQHRLLPLVAAAYAFLFTSSVVIRNLNRLFAAIAERGDSAGMGEVHAQQSALKSFVTTVTTDGLETARRCCGGHGFLKVSGLTELLGSYKQNVTVEGDNFLLTQQTARFLLKALAAATAFNDGRVPSGAAAAAAQIPELLRGDCSHLIGIRTLLDRRCGSQATAASFLQPEVQIAAFEALAAQLLVRVQRCLAAAAASGLSKADAWNDALVEVAAASRAHGQLVVVRSFWTSLDHPQHLTTAITRRGDHAAAEAAAAAATGSQSIPGWASLLPPLRRLASLFALWQLSSSLSPLLECGYFTGAHAQAVRDAVHGLLKELRPDAVALVDAFAFSDFQLNSALGRADGRAYEALFRSAQQSTLNKCEPVDGYAEYIRPLVTQQIRPSQAQAKL